MGCISGLGTGGFLDLEPGGFWDVGKRWILDTGVVGSGTRTGWILGKQQVDPGAGTEGLWARRPTPCSQNTPYIPCIGPLDPRRPTVTVRCVPPKGLSPHLTSREAFLGLRAL